MTRLAILLLSKDDFNDSVEYGMFASNVVNDSVVYGMFAITLVMTGSLMTRSLVTSLGLSMRLLLVTSFDKNKFVFVHLTERL